MTGLYGNDAFSVFSVKTVLQFFEIGFRFPEDLIQSESIENFNCQNMPISQTEGYF